MSKEQDGTGWCCLPVELLVKIFSRLLRGGSKGVRDVCRCARVCRNWSRDIWWTGFVDLSFIGLSARATDKLLQRLATTKLSRARGLDLSGWRNLTIKGLESITANCVHLEHVTISSGSRWMIDLEKTYIINRESYVTELKRDFVKQISQIKTLKGVDFSNVLNQGNGSQAFVDLIKDRNVGLSHLNFSGIRIIRSAIFVTICKHCPNLQLLNLSDTQVDHVCFEDLQLSCPKLTHLLLANLNITVKKRSLKRTDSEETLGFPYLEVLDVSCQRDGRVWCTDNVLGTLLRTSTGLRELKMAGCTQISSVLFDIPVQNLHSLGLAHRKMNLFSIDTICERWSETMTELDLSWSECARPFDEIVLKLSGNLNKMKELNLSGTSVSEDALNTLLRGCPQLESLDLTSCRGVQRGMKKLHDGIDSIKALRNGEKITETSTSSGKKRKRVPKESEPVSKPKRKPKQRKISGKKQKVVTLYCDSSGDDWSPHETDTPKEKPKLKQKRKSDQKKNSKKGAKSKLTDLSWFD